MRFLSVENERCSEAKIETKIAETGTEVAHDGFLKQKKRGLWAKCHATDLLYTHLTKKRESNGKERNQSSQIQY